MSLNQPSGCRSTALELSGSCVDAAVSFGKAAAAACVAAPLARASEAPTGFVSMRAGTPGLVALMGGCSSPRDDGSAVGLTRDQLDDRVLGVMRRLRAPRPAGFVAERAGASLMATVYSLRRLAKAGHVSMHTEIVDTPTRTGSTIVMYVLQRQPKSRWPAWLAPTDLPPTLSSRRIERG